MPTPTWGANPNRTLLDDDAELAATVNEREFWRTPLEQRVELELAPEVELAFGGDAW